MWLGHVERIALVAFFRPHPHQFHRPSHPRQPNHPLSDLNPGAGDGLISLNWLIEYQGNLYFSGRDAANGNELFKYDGMTESVVSNIRPGNGGSFPRDLVLFDGQLFFHAGDGTEKLFQYGGGNTISAVQFDSPTLLQMVNEPHELFVFNGDLYIKASDGVHGSELFKVSRVPEPSGRTFAIISFLPALLLYRRNLGGPIGHVKRYDYIDLNHE